MEDFRRQYEEAKKMTPEETRRIVTAICEADEERRREVGSEISDRVKSTVRSKMNDLERVTDDANKLLDEVLADENQSGSHSDAKSAKEEVKERWESVEKMTRSLRRANHPVVAFMLSQGQRAHSERQDSCHVKEFTLDAGRADCLMAHRRSVPRGRAQARQ